MLWRYRNHFPQATFAQSVTNPLPQSEAQTALTGMFPLAIYRKKGAAGAGIVEKPSRENEFKAFVPISILISLEVSIPANAFQYYLAAAAD